MKNRLILSALLGSFLGFLTGWELPAKELLLAESGKSSYVIVPPEKPSLMELLAVRELQDAFKKVTGADLKVASGGKKCIRLLREKSLAKEESLLMIRGEDLLLKGGDKFGVIYAVYTFLEEELGVRFFTRWGDNKYPRIKKLAVDFKPYKRKAAYPQRTLVAHNTYVGRETLPFYFRNRLNISNGFLRTLPHFPGAETIFRENGPGCHTLFYYIPPAKGAYPEALKFKTKKYYFKDHPEFFSLDRSGKRTRSMQLCFSNQELRKEFKRRFWEHVSLTGGKGVYSISAQDCPGKFCYCKGCEALAGKYRANIGPLLDLILELCREARGKYPHLYISTLAYRKEQSEVPPFLNGKKMPENFICVFAPIDDDFTKPLDHPNNKGTLENLRQWAKLCRYLWVWYYPLPYGGNEPFISLERNVKDIRLMLEAGATGAYFEHDVGLWDGCNFADLLNYLYLKLIQDPWQDSQKIVAEYCDFMYGAASSDMQKYIEKLESYTRKNKVHWIWNAGGLPEALSGENLLQYDKLFDTMEKKAARDPFALARIGEVRSMLDLTLLRKYRSIPRGEKLLPPPEVIRKRIEKNLLQAVDHRMKGNLKIYHKKRLSAYDARIRDAYIYASLAPKALPPPLAGKDSKKIRQLIPAVTNRCGIRKMEDAAFGLAIFHPDKGLELPFPCGFYDQISKRFLLSRKIRKEEIVPDRFHLYKVGSAPVGQSGYIWTMSNWKVGFNCKSLYIPGESPDKKYDIYLSIKFEGPAYSSRSKAKENRFYIDRAVFVDPAP